MSDTEDGHQAEGAEIVNLADHTPPNTTNDDPQDILEKLLELRRLLATRLIEAVQKPDAKASMLNVGRQFIFDNRKVLGEAEDMVPVVPDSTSDSDKGGGEEPPARLSHVAAAVLAIRDDLPFPPGGGSRTPRVAPSAASKPTSEPAWPPFKPPVDDTDQQSDSNF